jgi:hypothetical protein
VAHTVIVHGKGPSPLLLWLFANGWNVIIPKHIVEQDPINALKTQVIGTGSFRLKAPPFAPASCPKPNDARAAVQWRARHIRPAGRHAGWAPAARLHHAHLYL